MKRSLLWQFLTIQFAALFVLGGVFLYEFTDMTSKMSYKSAVENLLSKTQDISKVRGFYLKNVINKVLGSKDIIVSPDYANVEKTIPFQASFLTDLMHSQTNADNKLAFVSPYPFPNRAGRNLDGFQNDAWKFLNENPDKPFIRRETMDGREFVRLATADKMAEGCVACHNSHPDSPRKGWKVGDVRGIIEVSQSIEAINSVRQRMAGIRDGIEAVEHSAMDFSGSGRNLQTFVDASLHAAKDCQRFVKEVTVTATEFETTLSNVAGDTATVFHEAKQLSQNAEDLAGQLVKLEHATNAFRTMWDHAFMDADADGVHALAS